MMTKEEGDEIEKKIKQAATMGKLTAIWSSLTDGTKDMERTDDFHLYWSAESCVKEITSRICDGQTIDDHELDKLLGQIRTTNPRFLLKAARTIGHRLANDETFQLTSSSQKLWDLALKDDQEMAADLLRMWGSTPWYDDHTDVKPSILPKTHQRDIIAAARRNDVRLPRAFLLQFAGAIEEQELPELLPQTIEAFTWLAQQRKGEITADEIGTHLAAIHQHTTYFAKIDDRKAALLATLTSTIRPPDNAEVLRYIRNNPKCRNPKATYHHVAAQCANISADIIEESVLFIAKSTVNRKVTLNAPLQIPANATGDTLCKLLVFLAESADVREGMLLGIPSEQQLMERAFETQVGNQQLFTRALNSRDLLETRQETTTDHVELLWNSMEAMKRSNPRLETHLLDTGIRSEIEPEDLSAILHIAARIGTTETFTYTAFEQKNALWGRPLTEKTAHRLHSHLRTMGFAEDTTDRQKGGEAK
jgi:hypothetical protein